MAVRAFSVLRMENGAFDVIPNEMRALYRCCKPIRPRFSS